MLNLNDSFGLFLSSDLNFKKSVDLFLSRKFAIYFNNYENFESIHNYFVTRDFIFKWYILNKESFVLDTFSLFFLLKKIQTSLIFSFSFYSSLPRYLSTTYLELNFIYLPMFVTTNANIPLCYN